MSEITNVVLHDPENRFYSGALINSQMAEMYKARGVETLPVNAEKLRANGVSGFVMKHYGSGWVFNAFSPSMACPLVFFASPGPSRIHWKALLRKEKGAMTNGFIRLVGDTSQMHVSGAPLGDSNMVNLDKLPEDSDRIVVGGTCTLSMTGHHFVGLGLYGKGSGASVLWLAVTQTSNQ